MEKASWAFAHSSLGLVQGARRRLRGKPWDPSYRPRGTESVAQLTHSRSRHVIDLFRTRLRTDRRWSRVSCLTGGPAMADDFEYISRARLEYQGGYRHAYLGEVAEPVIYGVQGALREYYGAKEGPPIASTLDHIVAAVAG